MKNITTLLLATVILFGLKSNIFAKDCSSIATEQKWTYEYKIINDLIGNIGNLYISIKNENSFRKKTRIKEEKGSGLLLTQLKKY